MTLSGKRKAGRPRLQAEACMRAVGLPLTESDWAILCNVTNAMSKKASKGLSKQEAIRILIRTAGKNHD